MARNSRFRTTSSSTSGKSFSDRGKGNKKRFDKRSAAESGDSKKDSKDFREKKSSSRPFPEKGKRFQKPARRDQPARDSDRSRTTKAGENERFEKGKSGFKKPWQKKDESSEGRGGDKKLDRKSGSGRPSSFHKKGSESTQGHRISGKKSFDRRPTLVEKETESTVAGATDLIRLNKYISNSGVCSRREADELILAGLITVNGKSVTELGYKVKITDDVRYEGRRLKAEKPVYVLLNKPKGFITTTDDPQERNTVMQLVQGACKERIYPVGRLDRNTSGLLLLTNDGDLTEKLTHPSYEVKKIYSAELDRPLTKNDFQKIREGVRLEEGKAMVDDLAIVSDDGKTVGIEIHIGWNRVIRRIFEALGYEVVKLDRSVYATLDKKELPRGHWRYLRQDEIIRLKHFQ
ncbi:MAG TPA: pseudouridine synthase [Cyclobacteriaceae bacterium]|nr:pseudouridine synthase [Cyclobacteriaceae bacterium]